MSECGVQESEFGVVVLNNNVNLHSIVQNYYKIIDVSIDQESQNSRLIHTQELLKDAEVVTKVKNVDAEAASIEWLFLVSWMLVLLQNGYIWKMYYLKHYRCQNGGWSKIQKVKMVKNLKLIKTRMNKVKYESLRRLEVWISTQQVLKPV